MIAPFPSFRAAVLWILLLSASCERTLEYTGADIPDLLVMNALLSSSDSVHIVNLSVSERHTVSAISSGTVKCFINGEYVSEGVVVEGDSTPGGDDSIFSPYVPARMNQTSFSFRAKFRSGDLVRIEATANAGKLRAWSEVRVPSGVSAKIAEVDQGADCDAEFVIDFFDRPDEKNFYRLDAGYSRRDSLCLFEDGRLVSSEVKDFSGALFIDKGDDLILNEGAAFGSTPADGYGENKYNVFSDSFISGESASLSFVCRWMVSINPGLFGYSDSYADIRMNVFITEITETEYRLLKALDLYDRSGFDFTMNEPVSFPDNVEGGLGVVCISTPSVLSHTFPTLHIRDNDGTTMEE